jgi:hypothetical protein
MAMSMEKFLKLSILPLCKKTIATNTEEYWNLFKWLQNYTRQLATGNLTEKDVYKANRKMCVKRTVEMKIEAADGFKALVTFHRRARCYTVKYTTLYSYRNLIYHTLIITVLDFNC